MNLAVILLADTQSHDDLGRVLNALTTVREAADSGDDVRLIFDGAGTGWVGVLAEPNHPLHQLYRSAWSNVGGACTSCAKVFGHTEAIEAARVPLLNQYKQHPSLRTRVHDGFAVITF
jgi:hypothetical protein